MKKKRILIKHLSAYAEALKKKKLWYVHCSCKFSAADCGCAASLYALEHVIALEARDTSKVSADQPVNNA